MLRIVLDGRRPVLKSATPALDVPASARAAAVSGGAYRGTFVACWVGGGVLQRVQMPKSTFHWIRVVSWPPRLSSARRQFAGAFRIATSEIQYHQLPTGDEMRLYAAYRDAAAPSRLLRWPRAPCIRGRPGSTRSYRLCIFGLWVGRARRRGVGGVGLCRVGVQRARGAGHFKAHQYHKVQGFSHLSFVTFV